MRILPRTFLLAQFALAGTAVAQAPGPAGPAAESVGRAEAAALITPGEVHEHIAFLSQDALRGRDTPGPGLDSAAAYLARSFRAAGLEPGAADGEFVQRYPFPVVALDTARTGMAVAGDARARPLVYGSDFFAAAGRPDAATGELVFVGRASAAPQAVTAGVSGNAIPVAYLPGRPDRQWQQAAAGARRAAREAGAHAIVFVLDSAVTSIAVARLAELTGGPQRVLGSVDDIPAFFLRTQSAPALLRGAGRSLDTLLDASAEPGFQPVPLGGTGVRVSAPVRVLEEATAPNVVAILPGGDPELRDRYVVVSAHMDHVGVGTPDAAGDSIYNGADDNATGTATLLELAESFAALDERPARSLVFLAVSGEEKGLLGSRWFTDHEPTVPIGAVVANVNVDMIGRNSPDSIVVIGQEYSSLGPLVRSVAAERTALGLTVSEDLWPEQRFFFRSDHVNFVRAGIPSLFFFAGVHEDYHQPSDEADRIDVDKVVRVARLIFHAGHAIASDPEPPRWTEEGLAEIRPLLQH